MFGCIAGKKKGVAPSFGDKSAPPAPAHTQTVPDFFTGMPTTTTSASLAVFCFQTSGTDSAEMVECLVFAVFCKPNFGRKMCLLATEPLLLPCFPPCPLPGALTAPLCSNTCVTRRQSGALNINKLCCQNKWKCAFLCNSFYVVNPNCLKDGAGLLHFAQQEKAVMPFPFHVVRGLRQSWPGLSRPQHQHSPRQV